MTNRSNCQDARNQKEIVEIDCPECAAEGSIELFLRGGAVVEESRCEACGYVVPEGTIIE